MTAPDRLFLDFQSAVAGRYSLERELGRGGMGVVYLAREVRLDRPVAIKLLPPTLAAHPTLRERFLREARTAARLSHPHIVPIHAVDEVDRFVFYVMAYVEGETLARLLARRGALTAAEASRVLREVAWALAHAHEEGIVHRDVKPENILLERGTGRALVADFGIARLAEASGGTGVGEVLGTPDFMSPEQASGEPCDGRSDVYSLGVVGYYTLAGRLPFHGASPAQVLMRHLTQPPPPLASLVPALPRDLGKVIGRCLAKDPGARFQGARELADALGVTLARRTGLSDALRMFLTESESRSGLRLYPTALFAGLGVWIILDLGMYPLLATPPLLIRLMLDVVRFSVLGASLVAPWAVTLARLRRLIRAGHDRTELVAAIEADDRMRAEQARAARGAPPGTRRLVHRIWLGAVGVFGLLGSVALLNMEVTDPVWYSALLAASGAVAVMGSGVGWRAGVLTGARRRFWASRLGRWLFRVAGLGVGRIQPADGHRPTEAAVGLAIVALYESLPKETRQTLHDLPHVVQHLEGDARVMRQRIDELGEALSDVDGGRPRTGAHEETARDLGAARSAAQRRLAQAVAALETVRLDLLRLRGGVGSVDRLTADLAAVRELGEHVDFLVEGRREVERLLD
ncbi:MAG TPA: serine/threonine-protein kinase [Gemmatimonadales bacterium]